MTNKKTTAPQPTRSTPAKSKDPSPYPPGWNRKRAQSIIDHYDNQSDKAAIAEAEAAYHSSTSTMIQVPLALVAKVEKLIAKQAR